MMVKKKVVFVVNPVSGTKRKGNILRWIDRRIDRARYDYAVMETRYAGHATEIAASAVREGAWCVVAIGGDGTINEIGRSLIHTDTALGIIPCGSGNGLARHLRIPMSPEAAVEVINQGRTLCMDYGTINRNPFFCTCGVGFDAFVSLKFADSRRRGVLTYVEDTLRECLDYQPETYVVEHGGGKGLDGDGTVKRTGTMEYKAFLIACGNASQYGNNAYITPRASLTDGLMNVTVLEPFTLQDVPALACQLFYKNIDENPHVKTTLEKRIVIHRARPGVAHFDGNPLMADKDIEVEIVPAGLNVVVPSSGEDAGAFPAFRRITRYLGEIRPKDRTLALLRKKNLVRPKKGLR